MNHPGFFSRPRGSTKVNLHGFICVDYKHGKDKFEHTLQQRCADWSIHLPLTHKRWFASEGLSALCSA